MVETAQGEIRCEYVVNAAGYYAREVGKMFGRDVPMMVMSHQYILFDEIPELAAWSKEVGHKLPLLRDVDSSYYLRQEKYGMNLGPYEKNCRAHWATPDDPMPEDFSFQLFPDDLERLEWYLNDAVERVPILGTAGLSRVINGPIPYAPDGNPLIGPMPGVPNAFEACVFTFGICQAGGAGKVLAEWVTEGRTEWDMWSATRAATRTIPTRTIASPRAWRSTATNMQCIFRSTTGRPGAAGSSRRSMIALRRSALSSSPITAGNAPCGTRNRATTRQRLRRRPGEGKALGRSGSRRSVCRARCCRHSRPAGLLALPAERRGRARVALRPHHRPRTEARPHGLAYFADDKGRILTEMSVMAIEEDFFFLITAATAQWHDFEWLRKHRPADAAFTLDDVTVKFACQILTGPKSRAILAEVSDADLAKGWLTHQTAQIAGRYCQLVRVSFAGELGWEIHTKVEDTAAVFDAVWDAGQKHGLKPFGMEALDSLRIEKGYRAWKGDLSTDYTVLQGGLERFVDWAKPDFKGKAALEREKQQGVTSAS